MTKPSRAVRRKTRWPGVHTPPWVFFTFAGVALVDGVWLAVTDFWARTLTPVLIAAYFFVLPFTLRRAYREGWLEGRLAMLVSMDEAHRRGLSAVDWVQAEAERDGVRVRVIREGDPDA